jgi:hemerythrin superfamily protein
MKRKGQRKQNRGFMRGATHALQRGWAAVRDTLSSSDTEALGLLHAQHEAVEDLFKRIELAMERDHRRALGLVRELAEALTIHAAIEEQHFYPAVRTPKTAHLVAESFEEHRQMKRALADVVAAAEDGGELGAKISVLKEEVVHHAKEEEEAKLFPMVRTILDEDQREALGQAMIAAIVELQSKGTSMRPLRGQLVPA